MPNYIITGPNDVKYNVEAPEGASEDEIMSRVMEHHAANVSTIADVAKSAGVGVAKGAISIPGMPGDLQRLVPKAADFFREQAVKYGLMTQEEADADKAKAESLGARNHAGMLPGSAELQHKVEGVTGKFYEPQTRAGRYAQTAGEFLPASMAGPGGLVRRGITAATGGIGSEYAGEKTQGTWLEPYARIAGAVIGGGVPQMAARGITPNVISPERQAMINTLGSEGVTDLTAGQMTGNRALRKMESMAGQIPFGSHRAIEMDEAAKRQFAEAASTRMGEHDVLNPETMTSARDRIVKDFKDLSNRNNLQYDMPFVQDLQKVHSDYMHVLPSQQKEAVNKYFRDINNKGLGMSGSDYQETRSRLTKQSWTHRNSDPSYSQALGGIRDALDSAMGRSIAPADKMAWERARFQYGNMKRLEDAIGGATGDLAPLGLLSPQRLKQSVTAGRRGGYARGEGPFDELARSGSAVMSPLPDSGTPAGMHALTVMGAIPGLALGGAEGGLAGAALGHIADTIVPGVTAKAIMNPKVQNYLVNQRMAPMVQEGKEQLRKRLARALLQTQPKRLTAQPEESR